MRAVKLHGEQDWSPVRETLLRVKATTTLAFRGKANPPGIGRSPFGALPPGGCCLEQWLAPTPFGRFQPSGRKLSRLGIGCGQRLQNGRTSSSRKLKRLLGQIHRPNAVAD